MSGVSLTIEKGEFVGIMGRSGSGKTTLLNLIGGLDRDYQGKVEILGKDIAKLNDSEISRLRNESIGFIFQSYNLLPQLNCAENVSLPALFRRGNVLKIDERVDSVLDKVGLLDRKKDRPPMLSGGQKQRIAIARALFLEPKILLCDEPTGNLDEKTGTQLMESLKDLSQNDGLTVVLVTHEEHIASYCDRVIQIRDGCVQPEQREDS